MSARNGDKARFHVLRKRRISQRKAIKECRAKLAGVTPRAEGSPTSPAAKMDIDS